MKSQLNTEPSIQTALKATTISPPWNITAATNDSYQQPTPRETPGLSSGSPTLPPIQKFPMKNI